MNRRDRRRAGARGPLRAPTLGPHLGITPERLQDHPEAVAAGALVALNASGTAGPEDLDACRTAAHDALIAMVDDPGGVRLGPVCWSLHPPEERDRVLAHLIEEDGDKHADLVAFLADHPDGWIVVTTVVGIPAGSVP